MLLKILYVLFIIICCWITYLYTLNKVIKIAKMHDKTDEMIIDYLGKSFDHIRIIKIDINKISKKINEQEKMQSNTQK